MLRGLRAGPYYNNYPPFYMRGYINDKVSRLMGYATLRQVRVKKSKSFIHKHLTLFILMDFLKLIDTRDSPFCVLSADSSKFLNYDVFMSLKIILS